jgi:hypothetical protein
MIIQAIPTDPNLIAALIGCIVISALVGLVAAYCDKNFIKI